MTSAFGVEHGEIAKANMPRAAWATKAGKGIKTAGGHLKRLGRTAANAPVSVAGVGRVVGEATDIAGLSTRAAAEGMKKNPGLTGATALGSAAGYGVYRHKQGKKKP